MDSFTTAVSPPGVVAAGERAARGQSVADWSKMEEKLKIQSPDSTFNILLKLCSLTDMVRLFK